MRLSHYLLKICSKNAFKICKILVSLYHYARNKICCDKNIKESRSTQDFLHILL